MLQAFLETETEARKSFDALYNPEGVFTRLLTHRLKSTADFFRQHNDFVRTILDQELSGILHRAQDISAACVIEQHLETSSGVPTYASNKRTISPFFALSAITQRLLTQLRIAQLDVLDFSAFQQAVPAALNAMDAQTSASVLRVLFPQQPFPILSQLLGTPLSAQQDFGVLVRDALTQMSAGDFAHFSDQVLDPSRPSHQALLDQIRVFSDTDHAQVSIVEVIPRLSKTVLSILKPKVLSLIKEVDLYQLLTTLSWRAGYPLQADILHAGADTFVTFIDHLEQKSAVDDALLTTIKKSLFDFIETDVRAYYLTLASEKTETYFETLGEDSPFYLVANASSSSRNVLIDLPAQHGVFMRSSEPNALLVEAMLIKTHEVIRVGKCLLFYQKYQANESEHLTTFREQIYVIYCLKSLAKYYLSLYSLTQAQVAPLALEQLVQKTMDRIDQLSGCPDKPSGKKYALSALRIRSIIRHYRTNHEGFRALFDGPVMSKHVASDVVNQHVFAPSDALVSQYMQYCQRTKDAFYQSILQLKQASVGVIQKALADSLLGVVHNLGQDMAYYDLPVFFLAGSGFSEHVISRLSAALDLNALDEQDKHVFLEDLYGEFFDFYKKNNGLKCKWGALVPAGSGQTRHILLVAA